MQAYVLKLLLIVVGVRGIFGDGDHQARRCVIISETESFVGIAMPSTTSRLPPIVKL